MYTRWGRSDCPKSANIVYSGNMILNYEKENRPCCKRAQSFGNPFLNVIIRIKSVCVGKGGRDKRRPN